MSRAWHKRLTLGILVGLLALWMVLQYRHGERARDLYARQHLAVVEVVVSDADGRRLVRVPSPQVTLDEGLAGAVIQAIDERLVFVSGCLTTESGSRAPATLTIQLDDSGLVDESLRAELGHGELSDADVDCLRDALAPVDWPTTEDAALAVEGERQDDLEDEQRDLEDEQRDDSSDAPTPWSLQLLLRDSQLETRLEYAASRARELTGDGDSESP